MSVHVTNDATVESQTESLSHARVLWQNLARDVDVEASSAADGFPADAAQRPETYEYWQPTALPATWRWDLGASQAASPAPNTVNALGIAAHTLGSTGCSVKVQYSSDDTNWSDASDVAIPDDDSEILLLFPGRTERYGRLYIDGAGSPTPTDMPVIAVIQPGEALAMPRPIYGGVTPPNLSRDTVLSRRLSQGGHFLGQNFKRHGFVATAGPFRHLTAAFVRSTLKLFIESARQYPFFYAWRPSDFADEVVYGWATDDIKPSNMGIQSFMQVEWSMRAFNDE